MLGDFFQVFFLIFSEEKGQSLNLNCSIAFKCIFIRFVARFYSSYVPLLSSSVSRSLHVCQYCTKLELIGKYVWSPSAKIKKDFHEKEVQIKFEPSKTTRRLVVLGPWYSATLASIPLSVWNFKVVSHGIWNHTPVHDIVSLYFKWQKLWALFLDLIEYQPNMGIGCYKLYPFSIFSHNDYYIDFIEKKSQKRHLKCCFWKHIEIISIGLLNFLFIRQFYNFIFCQWVWDFTFYMKFFFLCTPRDIGIAVFLFVAD